MLDPAMMILWRLLCGLWDESVVFLDNQMGCVAPQSQRACQGLQMAFGPRPGCRRRIPPRVGLTARAPPLPVVVDPLNRTHNKGHNSMLNHPTLDKLHSLRLLGFSKAFQEQILSPDYADLSFEDRLGLLVDREVTERQNRRLSNRLKTAHLRLDAAIEDIDFRQPRGLDKSLTLSMASCQWIQNHDNCIITGPTGTGKTYLACALGNQACRQDLSTLYLRLPRLLDDLALARADGRYPRLLASLLRTDLVILDDWGTKPLSHDQRHDLFEIIEDRYSRRSTLVAGQLPVTHWHQIIGDPTLADAMLDRLVHNAHKITLKGDSMRKKKPTPSASSQKEI